MNKKTLIISAIIIVLLAVVLGLLLWWLFPQQNIIKASFVCNDNKTIIATFYPNADTHVNLQLSDGRNLSLPRAISASGARYANTDESTVFWNKGNTAFLQENNQTTFADCVIPGSQNNTQGQSVSDGTITFYYNANFGLAVTPEQVLVKSYIPPCDEGFDYCLYYNESTYKGTNFESAGLRIQKRKDLTIESSCLATPPIGFDVSFKPDKQSTNDTYSVSKFSNVGQGAAGHYTSGSLYRLFIKKSSTCYELETRIGESQFANYPTGTIKQFTDEDRQQLQVQLGNLLESITFNGTSQTLVLPQ